jgi:4-hydroxy-4-methyl-2-oxoglutarate aldolase
MSLTAISDSLDVLGVDGGCPGIRPVSTTAGCVGRAYTVSFEPVTGEGQGPAATYIDDVPAGSVVVIDNGGRPTCTVWGGLLTATAVRNHVTGTVVYGCCRDVAVAERMAYPLFSSGVYMKSGKNRVRLRARQVPVEIGGTTVRPGDVVVADAHGVLVVPASLLDDVVRLAAEIEEVERSIAEDLERGDTLERARARHGYDRYAFQRTPPRG